MKNTKIIAVAVVALIVGAAIGYGSAFLAPPTPLTPSVTTSVTPSSTSLHGTIPIGVNYPIAEITAGTTSLKAVQTAADDVNAWLTSVGAGWQMQLIPEDDGISPTVGLQKLQVLDAGWCAGMSMRTRKLGRGW